MIDNTLPENLIKWLDENIEEIHSMADLEIFISENYEDYWENNYDRFANDSMAYHEAKKKIQNLCNDYYKMRTDKLKF